MSMNLIYLAAGNSRRFGENKLLYRLNGKYMYRYGLEALVLAAGKHPDWRILLVSQYRGLLRDAADLPVTPVYSPDSNRGVSFSIRAGLQAGEAEYYGFLVADQPWLQAETLEGFFSGMEQGKYPLGCLCCRGEDGNPTCFHHSFRGELEALEGDRGGRKVLRNHASLIWRWPVTEAKELEDIDFLP